MADITFNCPYCEQKVEAPEEMAGTKADCPSCQCELLIPNQSLPKPVDTPPVIPEPRQIPVASASTFGNATASQPSPSPHFVAAKCPSCGGDLQVPDDRDQVKCMYCGGTVITRQAIQLASGVNVDNLIVLAKAAAVANNSKEAYDYYTKALEYDPRNSTAWAGKAEAAGWMSTLNDIRLMEMIAGLNNAIKYAPDSDKLSIQKHCAGVITRVADALFSIAKQHVEKFVQVGDSWQSYLNQCMQIISALENSHVLNPTNTETIKLIVYICSFNIKGISFNDFDGTPKAVFLSDQYEASLRKKIDEYTEKIKKLDPSFTKPQVQRASAGPCFVATATMGDFNHPAVVELRHFRDVWLSKRKTGRLFVNWYYTFGPYAAQIIRASWVLRRVSYFLIIRPILLVARRLIKDRYSFPA